MEHRGGLTAPGVRRARFLVGRPSSRLGRTRGAFDRRNAAGPALPPAADRSADRRPNLERLARDPDSSGAHGGRDCGLRRTKPGGTDVVERLSRGLGTQGQEHLRRCRNSAAALPVAGVRVHEPGLSDRPSARVRGDRVSSGSLGRPRHGSALSFLSARDAARPGGVVAPAGDRVRRRARRGGLRGELRLAVFGLADRHGGGPGGVHVRPDRHGGLGRPRRYGSGLPFAASSWRPSWPRRRRTRVSS